MALLPEHWKFSDNTYSHNHPMFGSVNEWFYKVLAGIQPAPEATGAWFLECIHAWKPGHCGKKAVTVEQ